MNQELKIIAHRGFHAGDKALENTFEAFQRAIEVGCDYIECDVLQTSDRVLICFHDKRYKDKSISEFAFEDLQRQLRAQNTELCTFERYLSLSTEIKLDIEIKESGYENQVWSMLKELPIESYVVKSFKIDVLKKLRICSPNMRLGLLIRKRTWNKKKNRSKTTIQSWIKIFKKYLKAGTSKKTFDKFALLRTQCQELDLSFVSPEMSILDDALLIQVQKLGIEVWPWTIKTKQHLDRMIKYNVQAVVTDIPDIAIDAKTTNIHSET